MAERNPRVLAIDAGGTMTDTFIVDRAGAVRRRQGPDDARGRVASASCARPEDALRYWGLEPSSAFPQMVSGIYSGTAMLNRLLERKGRKVGCIVSGGIEDTFKLERGIQTYLGYPYSDRLHVATHYHNEPLVPREADARACASGSTCFGDVAIPLYEDEVRAAASGAASTRASTAIVVYLLLLATATPGTRTRPRADRGSVRPSWRLNGSGPSVFLSTELYPMRRDFPRLNSTLIEAYAAEPSREQLERVRAVTREAGAGVRSARSWPRTAARSRWRRVSWRGR